jgi:hypothetical protein
MKKLFGALAAIIAGAAIGTFAQIGVLNPGGGSGGGSSYTAPTVHHATIRADGSSVTFTATSIDATDRQDLDSAARMRVVFDLTNATQMRVGYAHGTALAVTANLCVDWSTDNGATWTTDNVICSAMSTVANRTVPGTWANIPAGAKTTNVTLRVVATNGNGTEAPNAGNVWIQVK